MISSVGDLTCSLLELFWPGRCPICLAWLRAGDKNLVYGSGATRPALLHRSCLRGLPRSERTNSIHFPPPRQLVPVHVLWKDEPAFFRILHALKYGGRSALAQPLAEALGEAAASWMPQDSPAAVVPVPDDPRRRKERGFSLNALLAAGVGRACGLPCHADALVRRRAAPALATVQGSQERRRVLRGVFGVGRLAEISAGRPLLLVDDQVTTGATLEAALPLLAARGHPVVVLALAGARKAPKEVQP